MYRKENNEKWIFRYVQNCILISDKRTEVENLLLPRIVQLTLLTWSTGVVVYVVVVVDL